MTRNHRRPRLAQTPRPLRAAAIGAFCLILAAPAQARDYPPVIRLTWTEAEIVRQSVKRSFEQRGQNTEQIEFDDLIATGRMDGFTNICSWVRLDSNGHWMQFHHSAFPFSDPASHMTAISGVTSTSYLVGSSCDHAGATPARLLAETDPTNDPSP